MESIYKMFGYFKDFEKSLNKPIKGVLVIDKGVVSYKEDKNRIWILTHDKIEESIQYLIVSASEILYKPQPKYKIRRMSDII